MPLPYRTILAFPPSTDLVAFAERQVQAWIESAKKVEPRRRVGFATGAFLAPGLHDLGKGRQLQIVAADETESGTRRRLLRFNESNPSGTWQVDVVALDRPHSRRTTSDTLVVEARRVDKPDAEGQVDPPGLIKLLLAESAILDGRTPVTSAAQLINPADVQLVLDSILDPDRTVSVVVAGSPDENPTVLANFRAVIDSLTSKIVGTASVFVLSSSAVEELNRSLPRSHQLEAGRVRTYMPGVNTSYPADGYKHRVLGPLTLSRALRRGNRVALYLQQAFAQQTRGAQLKSPLSRDLQRNWAVLSSALAVVAREESVRAKLDEKRRSPAVTAAQTATLGERLVALIRRVVGLETPEGHHDPVEILEEHLARVQAATSALESDLRLAGEKLVNMQEQLDELTNEHDFRGLELADSEKRAGSLEGEVRWLRQKLAAIGNPEAFDRAPSDMWDTPNDLDELVLRLTPDVTDRPALTDRVLFVGEPKDVAEAHEQDRAGLDTQRIWDYVRVLYDYAVARAEGSVAANLHMCLKSDTYDGFKVPESRHVPIESEQTLNQWSEERAFEVPGLGPILMPAHFRSGKWVRMHYHDDTGPGGSGKIYIGYIGMHLTNTKTRNM